MVDKPATFASRLARLGVTGVVFMALLNTTGCTTIIANAIVERPDDPVRLGSTNYRRGISEVFNATAHAIETPAGTLAYLRVPSAPYDLELQAKNLQHNADGSTSAFLTVVWQPSKNRTPLSESVGTMVLLHGHSMVKELMAPWAAVFADAGFDVLLVDLPAHGQSEGAFVTYGVRESDGLAALLQHIANDQDSRRPLVVLGVSLGATTAIRSAAMQPGWDAVVALEPFDSATKVIPNFRDISPWWARWMMTPKRMQSAMRRAEAKADFQFVDAHLSPLLTGYTVPTLILHSEEDTLVPLEQSQAIAKAAPTAITLKSISNGGGHLMFPSNLIRRCTELMPWLAKQLAVVELESACKRIKFAKDFPRIEPFISLNDLGNEQSQQVDP